MAIERSQHTKIQDQVLTSAHRVWLAGLGAFSLLEESTGKAVDQLMDKGRELETRGRKQFDGLVKRGSKLETKGRKRVDALVGRAESTMDELQSEVDDRLAKVVERLGIPHRDEIRNLAKRVEALTHKVETFQREAGVAPTVTEPVAFHVIPARDGWGLKQAGSKELLGSYPTKDEALTAGRDRAQADEPSRLVVHRLDGSIQTSYSYGLEG